MMLSGEHRKESILKARCALDHEFGKAHRALRRAGSRAQTLLRTAPELDDKIRRLRQRWFLVRNVHATPSTTLLKPRWALSFLKGPMTLGDIERARGGRAS